MRQEQKGKVMGIWRVAGSTRVWNLAVRSVLAYNFAPSGDGAAYLRCTCLSFYKSFLLHDMLPPSCVQDTVGATKMNGVFQNHQPATLLSMQHEAKSSKSPPFLTYDCTSHKGNYPLMPSESKYVLDVFITRKEHRVSTRSPPPINEFAHKG
eukprot:scaffold29994_cov18-Tisochrysis_lutea.AAC.2